MRPLFVIAFCIIFFTGCSECEDDFTALKIETTTISKGQIYNYDYFIPRYGFVIYNEDEWQNFKSTVWQLNQYPASAQVDFEEFVVIAAIDRARITDEFDIEVESVTEYAANIVAKIRTEQSGEAIEGSARSYHIVKIPRPLKTIILKDAIY